MEISAQKNISSQYFSIMEKTKSKMQQHLEKKHRKIVKMPTSVLISTLQQMFFIV